jgi:hypothetical protein
VREKYCWLIADGWFVLREKYCWLVADKPSEQGACRRFTAPAMEERMGATHRWMERGEERDGSAADKKGEGGGARQLAGGGQGRQDVVAGCREAAGELVAGGRARRHGCEDMLMFFVFFLKRYEVCN